MYIRSKKVVSLCITTLLFIASCGSSHSGNRELAKLAYYSTSEQIIEKLEKRASNYKEHYILAKAYSKKKKYKKALFHFANSTFSSHAKQGLRLFPSPVYSYVDSFHFHSGLYDASVLEIAKIFFLYREYSYVIKFCDLITSSKIAIYRDAQLLKANCYVKLKKLNKALDVLTDLTSSFNDPASIKLIYLRKASLFLKQDNLKQAFNDFMQIIKKSSTSWQAGIAVKNIQILLKKKKLTPTKTEYELIAEALYHAKKYREAITTAARAYKTSGMLVTKKTRLIQIQSQTRLKKHKSALKIINTKSDYKKDKIEFKAAVARELRLIKKEWLAVPIYKEIYTSMREPYAEEALFRHAIFLEDRNRTAFIPLMKRYTRLYKNSRTEKCLWLLGRYYLRIKKDSNAFKHFTQCVNLFPKGNYWSRCKFWLYWLETEKANKNIAQNHLADMVKFAPDSSYTWFILKQVAEKTSKKSLKAKFTNAIKNKSAALLYHTLLYIKNKNASNCRKRINKLESSLPKAYKALEKTISTGETEGSYPTVFDKFKEFISVGDIPAISRELSILNKISSNNINLNILMAHSARKYGLHALELHHTFQLLKKKKLKENFALMPKETLLALFPRPFSNCMKKYSNISKINPHKLYSVMKAESSFNHRAISPVGAKGLMQFMPATARDIARNLKIKTYNLTDPCTSIKFGAHYLAWLESYYKKTFAYTVAAYNAGLGNVNKWKKRPLLSKLHYFIEFSPFSETRYYVLRTARYLLQYEILYAR